MAVQTQKQLEVAEDLRRRLTPPEKSAVAVEDANVFDIEEYRSLVAELDVDDTAIRNYEFRQFLLAEGIQVFDFAKVVSFMDAKVVEEGKKHGIQHLSWKWKPISERYPDVLKIPGPVSAGFSIDWTPIISREMRITFGTDSAATVVPTRSTRTYARAIPHAVLLVVKKLRDKFGEKVHFYASDYEVQDPDPFLMVTGPGLDYYVIERWDEPTFRS